jgi:hypothetical protein
MNTSTYKVLRNTVSKVKKSQATMPFGLRGEELLPGRAIPARGWPEACATKDRTDRRGGDDDAQALELTLDPHAPPAGVLPCHAHDQCPGLGVDRRASL